VITAAIAFSRSPSHCGGLNSSTRFAWMSTQLMTLKSESKIHSHPIVLSATGAAHGSRIRKRRIHLPRKSRTRKWESVAAPRTTMTFATTVKKIVFWSAVRKFGSCHWLVKLSRPTNSPLSAPAVASVRLR
jgi:hypothetical protein